MKARKQSNSFVKIISYIILLIIIISILGFLAFFTNDFTIDFKTFYVHYDKQDIFDKVDLTFTENKDIRFDIKYTFDIANKDEPKDFNVKVVPNVSNSNNFDFIVDGQKYLFGAEKDLTAGFDIKKYADYFTIKVNKNMEHILGCAYQNKQVELPNIDFSKQSYFTLVISSYDNKSLILVNFTCNVNVGVESILIDKGGIIF